MSESQHHHVRTLTLIIGVMVCVLIGVGLWIGVGTALDKTNSLSFCTGCHEMADNNFAEYKDTIHAHNRTGVKAVCSNCHVPHEFPDVLIRKVMAVKDIYHHLVGTIDTKEKFNDRRLEMAKTVWIRMKESDSHECRTCHDRSAMAPEMQGRVAQKQHLKLDDGSGATCIDCHFGIAHKQPPGGVEPQDVFDELKRSKATP